MAYMLCMLFYLCLMSGFVLSLSVFLENVGLCIIQNQDVVLVENSNFLLLSLSVSWIKWMMYVIFKTAAWPCVRC